ncbi:hypothetical protein AB9K41_10525, partial [Cribrihabitans sp. XS_ASV171]
MRRQRFRTGLALALALAALSGAAQEATLTPRELRGTAIEALRIGAPDRAYAYSEALLRRDPDDREAHLIRSRAARDTGRFGEAKVSARAAWKLASSDEEKYAASMVMAQALSSNGQRTMSQLWLRRAVEHAPDEALARRAIRDFKYVRARNPWATELSFAVTPDSNINNGSSERSSFLNYRLMEALYGQPVEYQLDGTLRALSGIEYALGLTTRYRFSETPTRAHDVIFTADVRHYTLSSEAKAIAPGAEGNDFA